MGFKKNSPGCSCCGPTECCADCKTELELEVYDSGDVSLGSLVVSVDCAQSCLNLTGTGSWPSWTPPLEASRPCGCPKGIPCNTPPQPSTHPFPKASGCLYFYEGTVGDLFSTADCAGDRLLVVLYPCHEGNWFASIQSSIHDASVGCYSTGWEWFQNTGPSQPDCDAIGDTDFELDHYATPVQLPANNPAPGPDIGLPQICIVNPGINEFYVAGNCFDDDENQCTAWTDLDVSYLRVRDAP